MADKQINELTAATTMENDDLLVLQQGGTAKKLSGKLLGDYVYNAAAEKIAEVNETVEEAREAVDELIRDKDTIAQAVASMAELGTDTTLTTPGMAADAKVTGEKISDAQEYALGIYDQVEAEPGSIVTFEDGAEGLPLKKLKVSIDPIQDLHGYDHPWPAGGGKNLLYQAQSKVQTINGVEWHMNSDGSITANGTASGASTFMTIASNDGIGVEFDGDYKFKTFPFASSTVMRGGLKIGDTWFNIYLNQSNNITGANGKITQLWFQVNDGQTANNITFYPMIYSASDTDPTAWTPYSNICPITGWTGASVTRTGKNLFDKNTVVVGQLNANGDVVSSPLRRVSDWIKVVPNTEYYVKDCIPGSQGRGAFAYDAYKNPMYTLAPRGVASAASGILFIPNGCCYIRLSVFQENLDSSALNHPSTDTTYESYSGTTYDITFPSEAGTVYGGTLEINQDGTGTLTVNMVAIDLGSLTWANYQAANHRFGAVISSMPETTIIWNDGSICSIYTVSGAGPSNLPNGNIKRYNSGAYKYIYISDSNFSDASEVAAGLAGQSYVGKLATPETYSLTVPQVKTLLGLNHIWADTGDITQLIYRAAGQTLNLSMLFETEKEMKATKSYDEETLVAIDKVLYKTTSPIATDESFIVGQNCVETKLGNMAILNYEVVS